MWPTRLLHSWDFPGKRTGVGCHFLLKGIFLTQVSNRDLLHCRQILYLLSHQGSLQDNSSALQLLCTLFLLLLLLHQPHLRSPGIRSQRLGTPGLEDDEGPGQVSLMPKETSLSTGRSLPANPCSPCLNSSQNKIPLRGSPLRAHFSVREVAGIRTGEC